MPSCARVFAAAAEALTRLPPPGPEVVDACDPGGFVVYAYVEQGRVRVAWVGGGTALLVRAGRTLCLTEAHFLGRELVKAGDPCRGSPFEYYGTRCRQAAVAPPVEMLSAPWAWRPGDRWVLVSGPILKTPEEQAIGRLASEGSNERAARSLVGATLARLNRGRFSVDACAVVASLSPTPQYPA